jgi:hypothetical protein
VTFFYFPKVLLFSVNAGNWGLVSNSVLTLLLKHITGHIDNPKLHRQQQQPKQSLDSGK